MFRWSKKFVSEYFRETQKKTQDVYHVGDVAIRLFAMLLVTIPRLDPMEYQLSLMNVIIELAIPTFYYYIWTNMKASILKRYSVSSLPIITSSQAPRRDGKSTFYQMVVCALLLCAPVRKDYVYGIGLVSINLEGSKKMIDDIYRMLQSINWPGVEIYATKTKIEVRHKDGINRVYGFQTGNVSEVYSGIISFFFCSSHH